MNKLPIIIPSYEPDNRLIVLLKELASIDMGFVILVNDGSNENYDAVFEEAKSIIESSGGILLIHDINRGKGAALKTAFEYIIDKYPDVLGAVTADSDGQHSPECIKLVMDCLESNPKNLILGVRDFDEEIPLKSKLGNKITIKVMKYTTGISVSDTQTGLRGIPTSFMHDLIYVKGDRFEFETQMFIESIDKYPIKEVNIKTIYDSVDNHQTHFDPFKDSLKIYKILGKQFFSFLISSLSSCILDLALFALFCSIFRVRISIGIYVGLSTVLARVFSSIFNFVLNYKKVFKSKENTVMAILKYYVLAVFQMVLSALFTTLLVLVFATVSEIILKVIVDVILFFLSFKIQQRFVFSGRNIEK